MERIFIGLTHVYCVGLQYCIKADDNHMRVTLRRILFIATLVIAGEMVFGLPFHIARFFRPTMLDVFGFTNTQLGDIFAIYGITATLSFFPGGALADRFSARKLLTLALMATAAGGLYMSTIPGAAQMAVLYGYFGVTTIFLLWGALIRATREWGGENSQGVAFGTLEGGRGLIAALVAGAGVFLLALSMPEDANLASDAERRAALRGVILLYSAVAFGAGLLAWFVVPESDTASLSKRNPFLGMLEVINRPLIWAQAAIIFSAYCLFKGTDYYSLYAQQAFGVDEVEAARWASYGAYLRVFAAFVAGYIADRYTSGRTILVAFALLAIAFSNLAFFTPGPFGTPIIFMNVVVTLCAVFALRGIYFALLEETRTPRHITGAAVGLVSVVGFTPDIFFAPIAGRILDAEPGIAGHMNLFVLLAVIAAAGIGVAIWLMRLQRSNSE
jgi:nitrate/nitrite transporter NarK